MSTDCLWNCLLSGLLSCVDDITLWEDLTCGLLSNGDKQQQPPVMLAPPPMTNAIPREVTIPQEVDADWYDSNDNASVQAILHVGHTSSGDDDDDDEEEDGFVNDGPFPQVDPTRHAMQYQEWLPPSQQRQRTTKRHPWSRPKWMQQSTPSDVSSCQSI